MGDKPTVMEGRNGALQVLDKGRTMCFAIGPGSLQAMLKGLAGQVEEGRLLQWIPEPDVEMCFDVDLLKKAFSAFPAKTTVRIGCVPHGGEDQGLLHIRGSTQPNFNGEALNVILCCVVEEPEADGSRPSDRVVLTKRETLEEDE